MSRDRSRSPASFSDSEEEDEPRSPESFSDSDEEDEPGSPASFSDSDEEGEPRSLESFSDSKEEDEPLTMQTGAQVVDTKKGEPLALQIWLREEEEGLHVRAEAVCGTRKDLLYTNEGFPGKGVTTCTNARGAFTGCRNLEETAELKQKPSFCEVCDWQLDQILHQNQQMHNSMMEFLNQLTSVFEKNQETQRSMMQTIQKTQQLVMMKLLPPQQRMQQQQPLQPAAAATLQPQPQLGLRTEEDEGKKNASADLM